MYPGDGCYDVNKRYASWSWAMLKAHTGDYRDYLA
jgi:hypothetical protein